jgi:predicted nucleic acid-binding protein
VKSETDMTNRPRVFLDTSALFAGIWSREGGGRMVLKLGEAGAVRLLVSPQVIRELEGALRRKAPRAMGALALILDRSAVEITETPSDTAVQNAFKLVDHGGDARILAALMSAGADYFITLDKEHFPENDAVREAIPIPTGTPGDFLDWFRKRLRS